MSDAKFTVEELKKMLAQQEEKERKSRIKEKKKHEVLVDQTALALYGLAETYADKGRTFKKSVQRLMESVRDSLNEYGKIPTNSKGGFSILSSCGTYKISVRRDTNRTWDSRADKGCELISSFLKDTIKKKDQEFYSVLLGFIQKNASGELEYSKVMELLKHEDSWTDDRWKEGLRLIRESFQISFKAYSYMFFKMNAQSGKFDRLEVNFSAL